MKSRIQYARDFFNKNPVNKTKGFVACHKVLSKLLSDFNNLCEKCEITYFAWSGNLVGAVRHGDFIPWDDDIDILMDIDSVNKLNKAIQFTDYKLEYHVIKNEKGLTYKFTKNSVPGSVDIFPITYSYSDLDPQEHRNQYLRYNMIKQGIKNIDERRELCDILYSTLSTPNGKYHYVDRMLFSSWGVNRFCNSLLYEDIYPLKKIYFEDTYIYIPKNPEIVIKTAIDNYDIPILFPRRHLQHEIVLKYCKNNNIEINGSEDEEIGPEYNRIAKKYYEYISNKNGVEANIVKIIMESEGIGTNKDIDSAIEEYRVILPKVQNDASKIVQYYDLLMKRGNEQDLIEADNLIEKTTLIEPSILLRKGYSIIRNRRIGDLKPIIDYLSKIDVEKELQLIDVVMGDSEIIDIFDVYQECKLLSELNIPKAHAYYLVMTVYGIHCQKDVDFNLINKLCKIDGVSQLFYNHLWKYRKYSKDTLWTICAYSESEDGLKYGLLGRIYDQGICGKINLDLAALNMEKATSLGILWAKWELFDILWKINTAESNDKMIKLAKLYSSVEQRDMMGRLGRAYREGRGVEKDYEKAEFWLSKAADKKLKWAIKELSELREQINEHSE